MVKKKVSKFKKFFESKLFAIISGFMFGLGFALYYFYQFAFLFVITGLGFFGLIYYFMFK